VDAIDWNWKPIAVRARNSKPRISQRRSIIKKTLPGLSSARPAASPLSCHFHAEIKLGPSLALG